MMTSKKKMSKKRERKYVNLFKLLKHVTWVIRPKTPHPKKPRNSIFNQSNFEGQHELIRQIYVISYEINITR